MTRDCNSGRVLQGHREHRAFEPAAPPRAAGMAVQLEHGKIQHTSKSRRRTMKPHDCWNLGTTPNLYTTLAAGALKLQLSSNFEAEASEHPSHRNLRRSKLGLSNSRRWVPSSERRVDECSGVCAATIFYRSQFYRSSLLLVQPILATL